MNNQIDIQNTKKFYLEECKSEVGQQWDEYRQQILDIPERNVEIVVWPTKPNIEG